MKSFDERGAGRRVAANLSDGDTVDDGYDRETTEEFKNGARWSFTAKEDAQPHAPLSRAPVGPSGRAVKFEEELDEPKKKYEWQEIPEVRLPRQNDMFLMRGSAPGSNLQRKTKKIVEQFSSAEDVFSLQEQEQVLTCTHTGAGREPAEPACGNSEPMPDAEISMSRWRYSLMMYET